MTTRHLCAIIDLAFAGVAHLVERDLAKVEVASSSLVARSTKNRTTHWVVLFFVICCGPRLERARAQREKRAGGTFWCPCACRGAAAPRASLVARGQVIERARETRLKFSLHTFPSLRYAGMQTAKPADSQKEDHSKGVAFFFGNVLRAGLNPPFVSSGAAGNCRRCGRPPAR